MNARVAFLLGRPPGPWSLLPDVAEALRQAGATASLFVVGRGEALPEEPFGADLVVLRSLDASTLAGARTLEGKGVRCCNSAAATAAARDKATAARLLAEAGVPVPGGEQVQAWSEVARVTGGRAAVVKSVGGSRGRGVLLVDAGALPPAAPFPGPYLVQEPVAGDGLDRKLYVVGDRVDGVLRRWPAATLADKLGVSFAPTPQLRRLALEAGAALGLEVYGVDVVAGPSGAAVVDVNAFPGFKGVPGAAASIAGYLHAAAAAEAVRCAR